MDNNEKKETQKNNENQDSNTTEKEIKNETQKGEKTMESLEKEIAQKQKLLDEYKKYCLTLRADFENYQKRAETNRKADSEREVEKMVKNILCVIDSLERAIIASEKNHDPESLMKGVKLTEKTLKDILKKEGLKPIECIGQEFDPNCHEALLAEQSDKKDSTILEELEKGYIFKGKVIRPSKVKIAKNE